MCQFHEINQLQSLLVLKKYSLELTDVWDSFVLSDSYGERLLWRDTAGEGRKKK